MSLTKLQRRALLWIDSFPCSQSEWRTGSKPAKGGPSNWDRLRLSGSDGSIDILVEDWRAISGLIEPAPFGKIGKIYMVSEAGRAALSEASS